MIAAGDLEKLEIVDRDDNEKKSFSVEVVDSVFDLGVYEYLNTAIFLMEAAFKQQSQFGTSNTI